MGVDENEPPLDSSIGLRVGGTTVPREVGAMVRLGAFSWLSVCGRDGVAVGLSGKSTPDVPPVGVLGGDVVETDPGLAVGPGVFLSSNSSFTSGSHIGAGEITRSTECPVGPLVGVMLA